MRVLICWNAILCVLAEKEQRCNVADGLCLVKERKIPVLGPLSPY